MSAHTGPYPYKGTAIENAQSEQATANKTFKQAKHTRTQWLTKKNPVRQKIDEPYAPFKGGEVR